MIKKVMNPLICHTMKRKGLLSVHHLDEVSRRAVATQKDLLKRILADNSGTEYGRLYGFSEISSIDDYRKKVPFTVYDHYAPYIERMIRNGEENLLTSEPVIHYAMTSGSVNVPKLIPVTRKTLDHYVVYAGNMIFGVLNEFYRDTTGKTLANGFCLNTLEAPPKTTPNGITKGAISGAVLRPYINLLGNFMTSPAEVIFPTEEMYLPYLKLLFALAEPNVTCMLSAFMTALVDLMTIMQSKWQMLCDDIEKGTINREVAMSEAMREKLQARLKPNPKRAEELRREFARGFDEPIIPRIWKKFQWVAAIGTGGFVQHTIRMRKYTGKNIPYSFLTYAASECLMGVARRTGDSSYVLLPDGGVFEFIPVDAKDENETCTIDQLEQGKDYEIVVTNLSGFYRYRMYDVVRVTGFYNEAPMIEFLYRKNQMISIAGEKTNDEAMRWMIARFHEDTGILVRDYSVFADTNHEPGRYVILIEPEEEIDPAELPRYREIVEKRLGEANPSFGEKIYRGILGRTKLCILQQETYMLYRDTLVYRGVSQNQIKPVRIIDTPMKEKFFFGLLDHETE